MRSAKSTRSSSSATPLGACLEVGDALGQFLRLRPAAGDLRLDAASPRLADRPERGAQEAGAERQHRGELATFSHATSVPRQFDVAPLRQQPFGEIEPLLELRHAVLRRLEIPDPLAQLVHLLEQVMAHAPSLEPPRDRAGNRVEHERRARHASRS